MQHNYTISNSSLTHLDQVGYLERTGRVVVKDVKTMEEICQQYIEHIQHMQQDTTGKIKTKYEWISDTLRQCFKSSFVSNEEKNEKKNEECMVSLISDYMGLLMCVSTEIHFSDGKTSVNFSNLLFELDKYQTCSNADFDKLKYFQCASKILTILQKKKKTNKKQKNKRRMCYYIEWSKIKTL
jgi:hypothetical protein